MEEPLESDRARLNFAAVAAELFAFLVDLGFSVVESTPTLVRYRRLDVIVEVYHGRMSYELGFEVNRHGQRYSMSTLMSVTDPVGARAYRHFAATTPEAIVKGLTQLAELVQRHARPALAGDAAFFEVLGTIQRSDARAYAAEVLASQLRPQARAAFQRGDYLQAVMLYEQMLPELTATERQRLALARKRAGHREQAQSSYAEKGADFVRFARALSEAAHSGDAASTHLELPRFLETVSAWANDMPGYFANEGRSVPEPSWGLFAMIVEAALTYE